MSAQVFIAVISAALLHAGWNAAVKGGADKRVTMAAVVFGHLPPTLIVLMFWPSPAVESLPWLVGGVALHTGYQIVLLNSYRIGDLTQVYPIARGSAPLIVAFVSIAFLGVTLAPLEVAAVAVIACAILSLGFVRRADGLRNARAGLLALTTGCFIAGYSLVDGYGARLAGTSLGFYAWLSTANALVFTLYLAPGGIGVFRDVVTKARLVFLIGGGASFAAYALVLWAFTQAPIALVTALRETSIAFALLIGAVVLKERFDLHKFAATMTMLIGAGLLHFARS